MIRGARVGIAVAADRVSVARFQTGELIWEAEAPYQDVADLEQTLGSLLESRPRVRFAASLALVSMGPSISQFRVLHDFPPVEDARTVGRIVENMKASLLVGSRGGLLTGGVHRALGGRWGVSAVDRAIALAVAGACGRNGIDVWGFVPSPAVLLRDVQSAAFRVADGAAIATARHDGQRLLDVRRTFREERAEPLDAIQSGGLPEARRAARAHYPDLTYACVPHHEGRGRRRARHWYRAMWFTTALLSGMAVARGVVLREASAALQEELTIAESMLGAVDGLEAELATLTAPWDELRVFDSGRLSAALVLDDLGRTLPSSAWLERLTVTSTGEVELAVRAPDLASVLKGLASIPGAEPPQVRGEVHHRSDPAVDHQFAEVRVSLDPRSRRSGGS